jgi:hypothetical protein
MAVAEHGDQHFFQRVTLADDDLADCCEDGIEFIGDRVLVIVHGHFGVRRLDAALRVAFFFFLTGDCSPHALPGKKKATGQSGVEPPHSKGRRTRTYSPVLASIGLKSTMEPFVQ